MSYGLIVSELAAQVLATIADEDWHAMFVMACLDLPADPHGMGRLSSSEGAFTTRNYAVGGAGMIVYVVNDAAETVTVTGVVWLG